MKTLVSEIVDRAIRSALELSTMETYDWATARAALKRMLDDLEARAGDDPSLERLRRFIAERDSGGSVS